LIRRDDTTVTVNNITTRSRNFSERELMMMRRYGIQSSVRR
jgi:hypothetical protein